MIKDKLKNADEYFGISDGIKKGLEWLKETDIDGLNDGKYIISDNIYANVQTYDTKQDAPYEAHREYIDIQYAAKGSEKIGVCDYSFCETVEEYNSERDIEFLKSSVNHLETLTEGEFIILFPEDAHQPGLDNGKKQSIKKIVVKVRV